MQVKFIHTLKTLRETACGILMVHNVPQDKLGVWQPWSKYHMSPGRGCSWMSWKSPPAASTRVTRTLAATAAAYCMVAKSDCAASSPGAAAILLGAGTSSPASNNSLYLHPIGRTDGRQDRHRELIDCAKGLDTAVVRRFTACLNTTARVQFGGIGCAPLDLGSIGHPFLLYIQLAKHGAHSFRSER